MNTRILLLAAAASLGSAIVSPAAHAGIIWNGPILQGPILQGPVLNGPTLNGPILQGVTLQGISLNGVAIASPAQPGRFMAVTLSSGETIPLR